MRTVSKTGRNEKGATHVTGVDCIVSLHILAISDMTPAGVWSSSPWKVSGAYRLEALLCGFMYQLVGDSQVAPSTQAVGSRAVTDVSAAWTPPLSAAADFMNVLSHPDVQTRATPEAAPLTAHYPLCGIVARAVCLLVHSLLPVVAQMLGEVIKDFDSMRIKLVGQRPCSQLYMQAAKQQLAQCM